MCGCSFGFICNLHIIFGSMFSATEYHLGLLKAKLAKCRQQLLEPTGKTGAKVVLDKLIVSYNRPDMMHFLAGCKTLSYLLVLVTYSSSIMRLGWREEKKKRLSPFQFSCYISGTVHCICLVVTRQCPK